MTLKNSQGYVIYKLPFEKEIFIRKGSWEKLTNQVNGFIVQEFDKSETLIIKGEKMVLNHSPFIEIPLKKNLGISLSKKEYLAQLNLFIKACQENLKKVISSREINIPVNSEYDILKLFKELTSKYENALIYLYNIPNKGMWIGATPETLLKSQGNNTSTMALAGSVPFKEKVIWEEKEKQEHLYVIEDISSKLKSQEIAHTIEKTETIKAAAVSHLKTTIKIESKVRDSIKIANILHPTSAICGMPQIEAKEFIINNEPYDREYYTGYLGEFDTFTKSWFFVNLRCLQVFNSSFKIYVGGGITKDSIAEKEWEETELKSRTLLSVIEKM